MIKFLISLSMLLAIGLSPVMAQSTPDSDSLPPYRVVAEDSSGELVLATTEHISSIRGIVAPADSNVSIADSDGVALISNGVAQVAASTINGSIQRGDLLSVSATPGIAAKADGAPFVLGSALTDLQSAPGTTQVATVDVLIDIRAADHGGVVGITAPDAVQAAADAIAGKAVPPVRAIGALIALVIGLGLSSLMYVGLRTSSVSTSQRNPDSKHIVVSTERTLYVIVASVLIVGVVSAYLILRTA